MAIGDQTLTINFSKGVDTKEDPWQLAFDKFLRRQNTVFTSDKKLNKRNGYGLLTTIPGATSITTYSDNLISIGTSLQLYSDETGKTTNTGYMQPMGLSVLPLVRRATSQTTVDTAIAPNGLACSVWLDSDGNSYYQINESTTGTTVIPVTSITSGTDVSATMPRVFVLGNYFILTWTATVSSTPTLRYLAIPYGSPTNTLGPTTISAQISAISGAYDGVAAAGPSLLYLAWNGSDGGGAIRIATLSSSLVLSSIVVNTALAASLLSVAFDTSQNQVWITAYNSGRLAKSAAYNQNLSIRLLDFTAVLSSTTVNKGLTSTANNGVLTIFFEVFNTYTYDSSLTTDYLASNTINVAGTAGSTVTFLRGVGLGSKAVYIPSLSKSFMLATYGSGYQPTYFLIDGSGNVLGKLAYENGGGYIINQILPQINLSTNSAGDTVLQIGYLFKDFLASIPNPTGPLASTTGTNKTMGAANTLPFYTQSGINLSAFTFGTYVPTLEIGNILHMGAGFPWMFDGVKPVEHQFHLWPDATEISAIAATGGGMTAQTYFYQQIYSWTDGQGNPQYSAPSVPISGVVVDGSGVTFHSVFASGVTSITVSSATGLFVGQIITDTTTGGNITAGTYITSISGTTVGLSLPTAGASTTTPGDGLKTINQGAVTVKLPTLRLTYKGTANNVRLRLFRWSTANQEFWETTSITSPTLNDPTVDFVTFTDTSNDLAIVGGSLLYTTGGVVEDVAAPSSSIFTEFDDRMWAVDAEDPYTLWYSKQVLAGTGVEFSDLFTYYVASNIGAQGPTGPVTAMAPMDVELILFKKNAIYYVNGNGPDNTGANSTYSQPTFITSTVGCTNQASVVTTDIGVMFQSDKGIWVVGRNLQTRYIGADVEAFNQYTVTSAKVIPKTTRVQFTISNGMTLVYDYFYGEWGTFSNTPALSATLYQDLHTYLNPYGQIVQETPGKYLDLGAPVLIGLTFAWVNMASVQGYQRFRELFLLAQYLSPHFLNVQLAYDYNPTVVQSSFIKPDNFSPSVPSPQGVPTPVGGPYNREQWRVHAKQQLCQSFQLSIDEVYDPSQGVVAGAGFSMSGITANVAIKKSTRPIPGKNAVG